MDLTDEDRAADWTRDEWGRSNNSVEYIQIVKEVERLIRTDARTLLAGRADMTARLIVSQLAHVHGMRPA